MPGLPDMQIPISVFASKRIILLGTINLVVLLKLISVPNEDLFKTAAGTTSKKFQLNDNEDKHSRVEVRNQNPKSYQKEWNT